MWGNEGVSQNALSLQAYRNSCRIRVSRNRMISGSLSLDSQSITDQRRLCRTVCGQFALFAGHPGHPSAVRGINWVGRLIKIPIWVETNLIEIRPLSVSLGDLRVALLFDRRHLVCAKNIQQASVKGHVWAMLSEMGKGYQSCCVILWNVTSLPVAKCERSLRRLGIWEPRYKRSSSCNCEILHVTELWMERANSEKNKEELETTG